MKAPAALTTLMVILLGSNLCMTEKAYGQRAQVAREAFEERLQDMNLSDEQEAKLAEVRQEFKPKIDQGAQALAGLVKEEVDKVKAVLTAEQREALGKLKGDRTERRAESVAERCAHLEELDLTADEMTKIAAVRQECRPKLAKAMEGLRGTLTDDQQRVRSESLDSGKTRREVIASLQLSDEQKQKLTAIGKEIGAVIREELEKVRGILSAEQQQKLADLKQERKEHVRDHMAHSIENFRDLNLTDEQKSQISAIRQEYRPKIHEAGNKLRAGVRDELAAMVAAIRG